MAKKKPERKTRKDKTDMVKTTFNVDEKILFEFKVAAMRQKTSMGELLRNFMIEYLKSEKHEG